MATHVVRGNNSVPRWIHWPIRLLVMLIIVASVPGMFFSNGGVREATPTEKVVRKARRLGLACELYRKDHAGRLPKSLRDLIPEYVHDKDEFRRLMFFDPGENTGTRKLKATYGVIKDDFGTPDDPSLRDWSYFGNSPSNLQSTAILIASPVPIESKGELKRIIAFVGVRDPVNDGVPRLMNESEFRRRLKAQRENTIIPP